MASPTNLKGDPPYPHFADEETEARGGGGRHSQQALKLQGQGGFWYSAGV